MGGDKRRTSKHLIMTQRRDLLVHIIVLISILSGHLVTFKAYYEDLNLKNSL